jgi:aryl-alcohol dehydrogenase-like predicted oxidoreductase
MDPDYAINNHLTPFISMQNHYNLVYREEEREMMPTLKVGVPYPSVITLIMIIGPWQQHFGVGSIPWSPLARGLLTRPLVSATTKRSEVDK